MAAKKTIDDVAGAAGVSPATVSRVLNGTGNVKSDKRDRVLSAVKAMRFKPNAQARILAGGRSETILFVHPLVDTPISWYDRLLETGALRGCSKNGFVLKTHFVFPQSTRRDAGIFKPIDAGECAGVILAAPFSDDADLIEAIQSRKMPMVLVASGTATRSLAPGLGMDDERAGYLLAGHLHDQGHRRFAFSLGLKDHLSAQERFNGARRCLNERGIAASDIFEAQGSLGFDGGYAAFEQLIASQFPASALICANDDSAAGAIHAAHNHKLYLPDDLSIVAFDDAPFAKLLSPPLTTVAQDIDSMASRAVDMLAEVMKGIRPSYEMTKPRLVLRESATHPKAV